MSDAIDRIMAYEDGTLPLDDVVDLFAELIRTGAAWTLQGSYGRAAQMMIDRGYVDRNGAVLRYPGCED